MGPERWLSGPKLSSQHLHQAINNHLNFNLSRYLHARVNTHN